MCNKNKIDKEKKPAKDVLTPVGELLWKSKTGKEDIDAEDMFDSPPVAGSAGIEC